MGVEIWRAEAPSNIALIKYMGKDDSSLNRPANSSLSYTLNHLVTAVEIRPSDLKVDSWTSLSGSGWVDPNLSEKGQQRFLKHFAFLKEQMGVKGLFELASANNFPGDCGLASSASSFAALTMATHQLALSNGDRALAEALSLEALSALSQRGSGSSCRSFFSPWALWRDQGAESLALPFQHLKHQVVVVDAKQKRVSSSEAHRLVTTSSLYSGRASRATDRLAKLLSALNVQDWQAAFAITWAEFWDMHALFETSQTPFGYMTAGSMAVLESVRKQWLEAGDGPLVTMDAGPNVHLLYRDDQGALAKQLGAKLASLGQVLE